MHEWMNPRFSAPFPNLSLLLPHFVHFDCYRQPNTANHPPEVLLLKYLHDGGSLRLHACQKNPTKK
jgi:hypothetical protein